LSCASSRLRPDHLLRQRHAKREHVVKHRHRHGRTPGFVCEL
jgi:hypothetical protein